jgi:hypothetical protein
MSVVVKMSVVVFQLQNLLSTSTLVWLPVDTAAKSFLPNTSVGASFPESPAFKRSDLLPVRKTSVLLPRSRTPAASPERDMYTRYRV